MMSTLRIALLSSLLIPALVFGQTYYRAGKNGESPSYPLVVDGSDVDGDLQSVSLLMVNNYDVLTESLLADELSATSTGVDTLTVNYDAVYWGPPGASYYYRAIGIDSSGLSASATGTVIVGDRTPVASVTNESIRGSGAGRTFNLGFSGSGDNDYDLSSAELYYRTKLPSEENFTEGWTQVDLSELTATVTGGGVNGKVIDAVGGEDQISCLVDFPATNGSEYQFRWVVYDAPEGDGALSAEALSGVLGNPVSMILNTIAYPKVGYEAWFETSDLTRETYDIN